MSYHGIFRTKYFYEILNIKVSSISKKAGEKHFSKERSESFLKSVHFLYCRRLHALRYQELSVGEEKKRERERKANRQTQRQMQRYRYKYGENFKTL